MHKFKVLVVFSAAAMLVAAVTACSLFRNRPKAKSISLAEYINAAEKPAEAKKPTFDMVLLVQPVEVEYRHVRSFSPTLIIHPSQRPFSPNGAFRGKFSKELREGAVAYFKKKKRFSKIDTDSGDLGLVLTWLGYEVGGAESPRMTVKLGIKIYHVSTGMELLVGKTESSVLVTPENLQKPVKVSIGEKEWILKEGTVALAQVSSSLYKRIDKQLLENKKRILKPINK